MKYNIEIQLKLKGHGIKKPYVIYGIDNTIIDQFELDEKTVHIHCDLDAGFHKIFLEYNNKTNDDPDMAVEILAVIYEGFELDRFKWESKYYPIYPQPWASEQKDLPSFQQSATYMGWNGKIEFEFSVPIYTWIHKIENLGWIYP